MLIIKFKRRNRSLVIIGLLLTLFIYNLFIFSPNIINNSFDTNYNDKIRSSATRIIEKQWLKNSNFSTQEAWNSTKGDLGDKSIVEAYISNGYGNFTVIGDTKTFTVVSGTPNNTLNSPGWKQFNNSNFLLPDDTRLDASGCYAYHES